jgi:tyrosine-protein kinase Etk/Wzc
VNDFKPIVPPASDEGIDFNKLSAVIRNNALLVILIIIITNSAAYLYIRYTKDVYESVSEIKLDIKKEATDFGFRDFTQDQDFKLVSGEIENIQSKLFLSQVIDSLNLHVTYFSIGKVLNFELYQNAPFKVEYSDIRNDYYNISFFIEPLSQNQFRLNVPSKELTVTGIFGRPLRLEGVSLLISRNPLSPFDNEIRYSFVINSKKNLLDYLQRNLDVAPLNLSANTIRVAFKDFNPVKAKDLVDGIDSLYLLYSNEQKNRANKQKIDWLSNELKQIEGRMESFENYFEDFTLKNRTSDLSADMRLTIEKINKIDSQRYEASRRLQNINELLDIFQKPELNLSLAGFNSLPAAMQPDVMKLQDLISEVDKLNLSYNENTYAYQQRMKDISATRKKISAQLKDYQTSWQQKLQELGKQKSRLESGFMNMPDQNTEFSKNERFYKLYEEFYLTLMQSKSEFEIAQAGSTPDFKILSTATLPEKPIEPKRKIVYGIGFTAGVMISLFMIGVLYVVNNKITNLQEIERLEQIPVLGSVPDIRKVSRESAFYVQENPRSMVSESIRTLRTNLDFFNTEGRLKVIAISSSISGEGKSFIARNLGAMMAMSKKKVLLVDLDMRKSKKILASSDPSKGMSTILIRKHAWQECVNATPVENLDFISSGPQPPNPAELMLNGDFHGFVEDVRKHYDYIILDTPPVGLVTDGVMAMKQADLSVYVFRVNYSKKDFINTLHRLINLNKFSRVTTVVNALPVPLDAYGYGYYDEKHTRSLKSLFKRGD